MLQRLKVNLLQKLLRQVAPPTTVAGGGVLGALNHIWVFVCSHCIDGEVGWGGVRGLGSGLAGSSVWCWEGGVTQF